MAATISSFIGNNEKVAHYIDVASDMGIELLPPDVNNSTLLFKPIEDGKILFALNGIKSVGDKVAKAIIEERNLNGKYRTLFDFLSRTKKYSVGDTTVEALIMTNGFSFTGRTRSTLLQALSLFSPISRDSHKRKNNGQRSIFSLLEPDVAEKISMPKVSDLEDKKENIIRWEKEYTSMYITYDPLEDYTVYLKDNRVLTPDMLVDRFNNGLEYTPGKFVFLLGVVGSVNSFQTKKGDFMAKPIIESKTTSISTLAFPKMYASDSGMAIKTPGNTVLIKGRISDSSSDGELEVIINSAVIVLDNHYFEDNPEASIYDDMPPEMSFFKTANANESKKEGAKQKAIEDTDVKTKPRGFYVNIKRDQIQEVVQIALRNFGASDFYVAIDGKIYKSDIKVNKNQQLINELEPILSSANICVV